MNRQPNSVIWSDPPLTGLVLGTDEVHIWRASLDRESSRLRLEAALCAEELARADRFAFKTDRSRFVAARGILRELLGAYLTLPATKVKLCCGNHGKPAIETKTSSSPLQFNLSHSGELAVYAFSYGRQLGIDVERFRPELARDEIAARYFSRKEIDELNALPPELRTEGFFLCWTRKEAYIKAKGDGLHIPLDTFHVSLTPDAPALLFSADESQWSIESFTPSPVLSPGHAAAIVVEGNTWSARYFNWRH